MYTVATTVVVVVGTTQYGIIIRRNNATTAELLLLLFNGFIIAAGDPGMRDHRKIYRISKKYIKKIGNTYTAILIEMCHKFINYDSKNKRR